ncbi:NUDIX domain-containing protein [Mucilaginibacter sp. FT3.2]|uniref:NUDIX domain-containing protein n=1 Tax=Mucilaginibacter sp. FT3.2 TaxID=2723090 RepID=UPI0016143150|nr:NUDIX domain-containing protein [Mucilaginibacter sp. FT3.2]MBB6230207.1 putative NUDIX family NTP pyrophosphohydrolase [Mucilaginibacter sp. FT3.2]
MPKHSAGVLLYRKLNDVLQVFLVHPGGPFWKNKDEGAWSIPKGEYEDSEDPLEAAKREFKEETGQYIDGRFTVLKSVKLKSGKIIDAWAMEGDIDHLQIKSNLFEMEWPPKTGKMQAFAEVDRGGWFTVDEAKVKINIAQVGLLEELLQLSNK